MPRSAASSSKTAASWVQQIIVSPALKAASAMFNWVVHRAVQAGRTSQPAARDKPWESIDWLPKQSHVINDLDTNSPRQPRPQNGVSWPSSSVQVSTNRDLRQTVFDRAVVRGTPRITPASLGHRTRLHTQAFLSGWTIRPSPPVLRLQVGQIDVSATKF